MLIHLRSKGVSKQNILSNLIFASKVSSMYLLGKNLFENIICAARIFPV